MDKSNNDIKLEGAKFSIMDTKGGIIKDGLITNSQGRFEEDIELELGEYILVETGAPDGYKALNEPITISLTGKDADSTELIKVENTKIELPKMDLEVDKVWLDENGEPMTENLPDKIEVTLIADGQETDRKLVLSEDNNWTGVFEGLESEGVEYSIKEEYVEGYSLEELNVVSRDKITLKNKKLPSTDPNEPTEPPTITKDINGKTHVDLEALDEEFTYHVKVTIPEGVRGYESLIIKDTLEDVLEAESVEIWLGSTKNKELSDLIEIDGQEVSLNLGDDYDYDELSGKLVTLIIKASVKEGADLYEYENNEVPNKADLKLNNNSDVASNTVTVRPPEPVDPEDPEDPEGPKPTEPKDPEKPMDPEETDPKELEKPKLPKTGEIHGIWVLLLGLLFQIVGIRLKLKKA